MRKCDLRGCARSLTADPETLRQSMVGWSDGLGLLESLVTKTPVMIWVMTTRG
jgi:hypothetical protein